MKEQRGREGEKERMRGREYERAAGEKRKIEGKKNGR